MDTATATFINLCAIKEERRYLLTSCSSGARERISTERSRSLAHGCLSRMWGALEDGSILRWPTRKHPIANIRRVAIEVLVEDVGDELLAGRR